MNIVIVYSIAVLAKQGVICVASLDKLADTSADNSLCFQPLKPRLKSGLDIVRKKYQTFRCGDVPAPLAEAMYGNSELLTKPIGYPSCLSITLPSLWGRWPP